MKLRTILLLALTLSAADLLFVSCYCDCDEGSRGNAVFCNITYEHLDNSGSSAVPATDTVIGDAYVLKVTLDAIKGEVCTNRSMPLFSGAYASGCECGEPQYDVYSMVSSLEIITLNDFDADHPAGSDVVDYFYEFRNQDYYLGRSAFTTPQIKDTGRISRELLLLTGPEQSGDFEFEVRALLTNGDTLSVTTTPIYLQ